MTNSSPISKARYSRGVGTIRRAALSSRAQARIDRGLRPASSRRSQVRVRPVSTMSSTTITSRSWMSSSMSLTIRTRPVSGA